MVGEDEVDVVGGPADHEDGHHQPKHLGQPPPLPPAPQHRGVGEQVGWGEVHPAIPYRLVWNLIFGIKSLVLMTVQFF